ncbi:MAG TPA: DUF1549 domain-containing protein [Gemmataceae bacterium]|nr:DUF1549 domain-containing protein [Gemmataceae bacterium]
MTSVPRMLAVVIVVGIVAPACADPQVSRLIDEQITARLREAKVAPVGRADHATLVRRIYLDLLGRPPTSTEAEVYLSDPAADKHYRLIRKLRDYPETAAHWRRVIAGWLQGPQGGELLGYLAGSVVHNRGWDQVARELLDPDPRQPAHGGAAAYLEHFLQGEDKKAGREAATVAVASAFFGAQLQCARCHDHPTVPAWTKAHFEGLRAFFDHTEVASSSRADLAESGLRLIETTVRKGATRPMFLDGTTFNPGDRPRTRLAQHALRPEAVHFKQAVVNRVWKELLGRGLVEPVDMIHDGNPASHPALFERLADDFAANGFNFDRLLASIMNSDTYLRSDRWPGPGDRRPAPELFAVAELRPLSGPQTAWAAAVATGYHREIVTSSRRAGFPMRGPGLPLEARSLWEGTEQYAKLADRFRAGRPATTAGDAIYLTFDPFVKALLDPKWGLVREMMDEDDDEGAVTLAYVSVLSRRPSPDELSVVRAHIKSAKTRAEGCRDVVWALLAGAEFRFNH